MSCWSNSLQFVWNFRKINFIVHYATWLDSNKTDDTKERNKPELFVLGSNQLDLDFEKAIMTMKNHEISKLVF